MPKFAAPRALTSQPTRINQLPYPVIIGAGAERELAALLAARPAENVVFACDEHVEHHARRFAKALPGRPRVLSFALGERRKHLRTVEKVLDALAELGADRRTVLVGVGGGVAGDLFGFVAACYMRGIPFVNIATSVVAMVDASVGGKTGVDLRAGKNLAGAFSDPIGVFAAVETLATLPARHIREGLGEVVKHAVLDGEAAFARLEGRAGIPFADWPWQEVVAESVRLKADVVLDDRLESGRREVLNLGHTFAHGFEYATHYRMSHGAAVAIGLRAAGLLAGEILGFAPDEHARIVALLQALRLPVYSDALDIDVVLEGMAADKKARGGMLRFVLPQKIGDVRFGVPAARSQVRRVLRMIGKAPTAREV